MSQAVIYPVPTEAFSIKECLRAYTIESLGEICDRWKLVASTQEARIRAIEKVLSDPLHIQDALSRLQPQEARLVHLLARRNATRAADLVGVPGIIGTSRPEEALREVAALGLALASPLEQSGAFSLNQLTRNHAGGKPSWVNKPLWLQTPELVRAQAPPALPLEIRLPVETGPIVTNGSVKDGAASAFMETLRIVEVLGPRLTHTGELHKSDSARARELAQEAGVSSEALALALVVALEMRCVEQRQGRLSTTQEAARWAAQTAADRTRELFRAYLNSEDLTDVRLFFTPLFPAMEEHLSKGSLRRTYPKTLVASILAGQIADAWHAVDALGDTIRQIDPNIFFLEERWRALAAHVPDVTQAWQERSWQTQEKRYFAWLIQSLFARLGIVELANEGRVFRISPVGRYALGVDNAPEDVAVSEHEAVVVQPDFEVIAYMDRCPPDLRRKLDAFCERVRGGTVSTYRLTQESLYRGVRTGTTITDFLQALELHAQRDLPGNVRDQIATWERKVESVSITIGCRLVEFRDAQRANEFARTHDGSRLIGDRFVLLSQGSDPEGATKIDYRKPLTPSLVQEAGLRLRSPWEQTSLFIHRQLADIGELSLSSGNGYVLELSKPSLRKDVEWGLHVAQLEALLGAPLAARFRTALRTWCGEEAPAKVHTVTLVRFDSSGACDTVFELPEAAKLVEGRLGLYSVVIAKGKLSAFKQTLKKYGLTIERADAPPNDGAPAQWAARWVERNNGHETRDEPAKESTSEKEGDSENAVALPSYSPRLVGEIIGDAIRRRKPLLIQYHSAWSATPTVRRVNPVSLDLLGSAPSFSGYCHRAGASREFKLARVTGIRILEDESF